MHESPVPVPAAVATSTPGRTPPVETIRVVDPDRSRGQILAAIALVLTPLALDLPTPRPEWLALGVAFGAVAVLIMVTELVDGRPRVSRLVPAGLYLVAIACLRHSAGGGESGYSSLVLLAVLLLAFLGTRRDLLIGLAFIAIVLAAPIVVFGAPDYPFGEWKRVVFTTVVGAFIGFALRRVLATLAQETDHTRDQREALARQVEVTTAILDTATDAIVSFDGDGRVTAANPAAQALLGRTADAMVGEAMLLDLVADADADRDRLRAGLARWRSDGPLADRDRRFEAEMIRADGTHVPVEVTITRTQEPDGPRFHAFSRDITERRAVEQADHEHLDDLARLAAARDIAHRGEDGRKAICAAAIELTRADMALFIEVAPDGGLEATGTVGTGDDVPHVQVAKRSVSSIVTETAKPAFVGDLLSDPRADQEMARRLNIRAAYWQPIVTDGRTIGVLVVCWREVRASMSARVASLLGLFATQTAAVVERADLLARLEKLARTDPLTGASNRRAMEESLARILAGAPRGRRPVSIAMLDLDNFKRYNDGRGHQAGDGLLRDVVANWQAQLRPNDELARYGGEEFLVILPDCDLDTARRIADRLRSVVPDGQTVSAGVAQWDGLETSTALIARSDAGLYAAKAAGRDRTMLGAESVAVPVAANARTG